MLVPNCCICISSENLDRVTRVPKDKHILIRVEIMRIKVVVVGNANMLRSKHSRQKSKTRSFHGKYCLRHTNTNFSFKYIESPKNEE